MIPTLPKFPIKVCFDPAKDPKTLAIFKDDAARTLYLLWRPKHLVDQNFNQDVLDFADYFWKNRPKNLEQFMKVFTRGTSGSSNFNNPTGWITGDVKEYAEIMWPHFRDDCDSVEYEVTA